MRMGVGQWLAAWGLLMMGGCAVDNSALETAPTEMFVPIPRTEDGIASGYSAAVDAVARVAALGLRDDENFYLAIRKDALSRRWFLSAFLEQYFPGAVEAGAARTLGTKVVTFRIQNDKLFVFDADERKKTSDTFDPKVLVEAYPLVSGVRFAGRRNYVVIDPSAGLNRFDIVSDAFASGLLGPDRDPRRFKLELSFLEGFRRLSDGMSFRQVFTGYAETPLSEEPGVEENVYRASGSLRVALRAYSEGPEYVETPLPARSYFFTSAPRVVPNTGRTEQVAARWAIYPGMAPIEWLITANFAELDQSPAWAAYDLVGAVRRGVESWNDAFGFPVFSLRVATPAESTPDDDRNLLIFDENPRVGFAFANWRSNPNTGEIRGASVYFGAGWLGQPASNRPEGAAPTTTSTTWSPPSEAAPPTLAWASMQGEPRCFLRRPEHHEDEVLVPGATEATPQERLEQELVWLIAHEIGHTLGLRHNFKGSLRTPSTSVMDYLRPQSQRSLSLPAPYDVEAVSYLYGLSDVPPAQPFCTDGDTLTDPDCGQYDLGGEPLFEYWGPIFQRYVGQLLALPFTISLGPVFDSLAAPTLAYLRAGATPQPAFEVAFARVAAPIDPAELAENPAFGDIADGIAQRLLYLLFQGTLEERIGFARFGLKPFEDPVDPTVRQLLQEQLARILRNEDGIRRFPSRRLSVDILQSFQTLDAYRILLEAKAAISAEIQLGGLDAVALGLSRDLLARIEAATEPYFE